MARASLAAALTSAALLPGCLQDRVTVDVTVQVHAGGSCTRHTEYRLERVDSETGSTRALAPPDALETLHRFPSGDAWTTHDETLGDVHSVTLDATLPSANEIGWDYWRARSDKSHPARNRVSFDMATEGDSTVYDYAETFADPMSPLMAARLVARTMLRKDDDFAAEFRRVLPEPRPGKGDAKRAFRERLALPFSRDVADLGHAQLPGRSERARVRRLMEGIDERGAALEAALASLSPGIERSAVKAAIDAAWKPLEAALDKEAEGSDALAALMDEDRVRFRVTLVMPAPIVRANACIQGDSVTWEFDQDDLYGRGFEMWARAASR